MLISVMRATQSNEIIDGISSSFRNWLKMMEVYPSFLGAASSSVVDMSTLTLIAKSEFMFDCRWKWRSLPRFLAP